MKKLFDSEKREVISMEKMRAGKCATLVFAAAALLFLVAGQAGAARKTQPRLLWPSPPGRARIEFVRCIHAPSDMRIKKGFFAKLWAWIIGEKKHKMLKPFGVFAGGDGRLYVTDTVGRSVHVFDPEEDKYFDIEGAKGRRFASPIDVAADKEGNIYVSDSVLKAVYVFNKKGKFLRKIGGGLRRPTGIAIDDAAGTIYVVDTLAGRILVYRLDGRYIKAITGPFAAPTFMAIGRDGRLYVSDSMNARVDILDKNGRFLGAIGSRGDAPGDLANPRGIAIDADGHIYVTDTLFNSVTIYNGKGRCLLVFGSEGTRDGEFAIPAGISIAGNFIYVADSYNMRIQEFRYLGGK